MIPIEVVRYTRRVDEELWRVVPVGDVAVGLTYTARVFGIDPEDGAILWREGPFSDHADLWPSADPSAAIVRTGLRTFRAYDPRRGQPVWETAVEVPSPDEHVAALALPSGLVLACGATVEALDWKERDLVWSADLEADAVIRLWEGAGGIVIAEGRSTLHAVRASDGRVLWRREFGMVRRLVVWGPRVLALDRDRLIVADLESGNELAVQPSPAGDVEGWGWPVEAGEALAWPGTDPNGAPDVAFYRWTPTAARVARRTRLPAPPMGRPLYAAPMLYVPLSDGTILEFDDKHRTRRRLRTEMSRPTEGSWAPHEQHLVAVGAQRLFFFQDFVAGW